VSAVGIQRSASPRCGQRRDAIDSLEVAGAPSLASSMRRRSDFPFTPHSRNDNLIGLNPGGSDSHPYIGDERESSSWWAAQRDKLGHPFSSFLDESWGKGQHQSNVRKLLSHYGDGDTADSRIRSAFASNLYSLEHLTRKVCSSTLTIRRIGRLHCSAAVGNLHREQRLVLGLFEVQGIRSRGPHDRSRITRPTASCRQEENKGVCLPATLSGRAEWCAGRRNSTFVLSRVDVGADCGIGRNHC
jgi:hypothetical protein